MKHNTDDLNLLSFTLIILCTTDNIFCRKKSLNMYVCMSMVTFFVFSLLHNSKLKIHYFCARQISLCFRAMHTDVKVRYVVVHQVFHSHQIAHGCTNNSCYEVNQTLNPLIVLFISQILSICIFHPLTLKHHFNVTVSSICSPNPLSCRLQY